MSLKNGLHIRVIFFTSIVLTFLTTLLIGAHSQAAFPPKVKPIQKGFTLDYLLQKYSFTSGHKAQIFAQNPQLKVFPLSLEQRYLVHKTKSRFELWIFELNNDKVAKFWRENKQAGFISEVADLEQKILTARGKTSGSLLLSIMNQVDSLKIAYRFMDAFKLKHNLNHLTRGAPFYLKYEKLFYKGKFVKYGEVLEAHLTINGQKIEKYFISTIGGGGAFIDLHNRDYDKPFFAPVNYLRISSLYKPRRFHPIKKRRIAHLGVDFELPKGAPVFAVKDGRIVKSGKNRASGRFVFIEHDNGFVSSYHHLNKIYDNVEKGAQVFEGETIGEVGCSGYCTKPHLHFSLKKDGQPTNPAKWIKSYSASQAAYLDTKRNQLLLENQRL